MRRQRGSVVHTSAHKMGKARPGPNGRQWRYCLERDCNHVEGARTIIIDIDTGEWLDPKPAITGEEGQRIASAVLPGTPPEEVGKAYKLWMSELPQIVCLCGSTRFYDTFQEANYELTMKGFIVLSVGFYPHATAEHGHGEGVGHDSDEKIKLDELHKRKIDLADYVVVLNVGGYIGESTRSEIAYAEATGKPVRYLEER